MILEALLPERRSRTGPSVSPAEGAGPFWGGADSLTGLPFTATNALANGSVLQAVLLLGSIVGAMPRIVFDRSKGDGFRATGHNLWWILHDEPNPESTAATFQFAQIANKLLHGNSYAEIERWPTGMPRHLWHLPAELVTPRRVYKRAGGGVTYDQAAATPEDRRSGGAIVYEVAGCQGDGPTYIPAVNMFHVPWMSLDGIKGRSPVAIAMETVSVGRAIITAAASHFGNGAVPGGWLERPETAEPLTPTGERNLLAAWEKQHGGVNRRGRTAILQEGTKFHPTSVPMAESQLFEMLAHQPQLVAQIFNIPPYLLGHDGSGNTYANVESQFDRLLKQTLLIHLEQDEQECYRKLVSTREGPSIYVEYEVKQLLRGDTAARAAFYKTMRELGVMSPNDIARAENLPPIPAGQGGDDYAPPKPPAPVATAEAGSEPKPEPKATPPASRSADVARRLLRAGVDRCVAKETSAIRKQAERLPLDGSAAFAAWVDDFYSRHVLFAAQVLPLGEVAERWAIGEAFRHRSELRELTRESTDPAAVAALLDRWTAEANERADQLSAEAAA